ncbi:hypothetical protein KKH07_00410 [Patescibacteria group bacterium]|nr:hypothetical protein [Patescibacteria group bacterium]MBU1563558.1 hypothetical protein [Patescibacteria group bacterium]MBU2068200.1 hypothetical protein [Patescibacteria group bacterium]
MIENDNKQDELVDLSDALKDSDDSVKVQKEQQSSQVFYPGTPKIIQWTIKYSGGLIKNEKQANYVLIGFVAVLVIIILILFFSGGKNQIEVPPLRTPTLP